MGYTPNYSHLVGIMISKTIGCRVHYFQTNPSMIGEFMMFVFVQPRLRKKGAGSTRAHLGLQFGVQASLRGRCEAFTCDVLWVACLHRRVDPKIIHVSKAKTGTTFPHLPFWWAETRNHQFNLDGLWHCFANILASLMGKTNSKWRQPLSQHHRRCARISASALSKKGEIWDTPSSSHSHGVMMG